MLEHRLVQLRKNAGLNQAQVARLLHTSTSAQGMYEQGRRTPSLELLVAISQLYDVSLDYLITGAEFVSRKNRPPVSINPRYTFHLDDD